MCRLSCFWVDKMMMVPPFSLRPRRTCEKIIFENHNSNNLIARKRTLKSYFPTTPTIEITSEIDEKSRIFFEDFFYYIDQVPLSHSTKL